MTHIGVFILLLTSGCAATHSGMMDRAYEDETYEAKRLVESGNLQEAVDELTTLLEVYPQKNEIRLLRAMAYQRQEKFDQAIQDYENILQIDPANQKAHYNLGMVFAYKLRDTRHALEHLDKFLSSGVDHDKASQVAELMCRLDNGASSSEIESQGLADLLQHLSSLSDVDAKRRRLQEAAALNPKSPVPFYLIGQLEEKEGKLEEARKAYHQSLEVRPTCVSCHEALGKLLIHRRDMEEGERHLAKAKLFDQARLRATKNKKGEAS